MTLVLPVTGNIPGTPSPRVHQVAVVAGSTEWGALMSTPNVKEVARFTQGYGSLALEWIVFEGAGVPHVVSIGGTLIGWGDRVVRWDRSEFVP